MREWIAMEATLISFNTSDSYYADAAVRIREKCRTLGIAHSIDEIPFTGSWVGITRQKPRFILDKMNELNVPVLWTDVDNQLLHPPDFIDGLHDFDVIAPLLEPARVAEWMPPNARVNSAGQCGRILPDDGSCYWRDEVRRTGEIQLIDTVVRGYFVQTSNLVHLLRLKLQLGHERGDDLMLCMSMKVYGRLNNYLTASSGHSEERMNKQELADQYALCRRPEHISERDEVVRQIHALGWRSCQTQARRTPAT